MARLRDSLDLGVLARARDCAQDYDGALAAGASAVAAEPVNPLARAFFSEALADAGLYSRSRAQLVQAGQAPADAYTRSEVERDWANLYRDEGDAQQELNHVQVPFDAVETWADSVYHRYPLLDTSASGAGFGTARAGTFSVEVMDIGLRAPAGGATVVYPVPGASGEPPDFPGSELPDPAPGAQYPIGYPITVAAGASSILDVTATALTDASGRQLPVYSDRPG
ncbi:MAG: hypothetical protein ACREPI_09765, partial [Candidatus Dormibacterales bacterium]